MRMVVRCDKGEMGEGVVGIFKTSDHPLKSGGNVLYLCIHRFPLVNNFLFSIL